MTWSILTGLDSVGELKGNWQALSQMGNGKIAKVDKQWTYQSKLWLVNIGFSMRRAEQSSSLHWL